MDSTPVSLLERLRQPDDGVAWERFVHLYTPLLYRWLARTGMQEADVADLLQEVLAALVRELPAFRRRPDQSFHRWLYAVVMNRWRDRLKRRPLATLPAIDPPAPDDLETFIEAEYREQLVKRVWGILRADFSPTTVRVFNDVVLLARPPAEVAAEQGTTVGAIYAIKHRVLDRIRRELAGII